jgi:hypothetical protein
MEQDIIEFRKSQIDFDEEQHAYTYQGKKFDSVTSYIKTKFKPFVEQEKSLKLANDLIEKHSELLEGEVSDLEVFREFLRKRFIERWQEASRKGKEIHKSIECYLKGEINYGNEKVVDQVKQFVDMYDLIPYKTECIVFHEEMRIAGTIDAIFKSRKTGGFIMVDWKNIKKLGFPEWYYRSGQPPFEKIQDCKFNRNSLQLLFYKYILRKKYNIKIERCYLFISDLVGNDWKLLDINRFDLRKIARHRLHELSQENLEV